MKFKLIVKYAKKYKHYRFQFKSPELVEVYKKMIDEWVVEENKDRKERYATDRQDILNDPDYKGHPRKLAAALKEHDEDEEYKEVAAKDFESQAYNYYRELRPRLNINPHTGEFEFGFQREMDMKDMMVKANAQHKRRFKRKEVEEVVEVKEVPNEGPEAPVA